jgi:hypothetical protein
VALFVVMLVRACPRCASTEVRGPTIADGIWPGGGELQKLVCDECGFQGMMVEFDREEDYLAFRLEKRGPPGEEKGALHVASTAEKALAIASEIADERARHSGLRHETDAIDKSRIVPLLVFLFGLGNVILGFVVATGLYASERTADYGDQAGAIVVILFGVPFIVVAHRMWTKAR